MTLMHNEFEGKPEIIFITYDEVIRNPYPFLLEKIDTKLRSFYEPFLDVDKFKGFDRKNLLRLCTQRTDKQLFRYLQKHDFDTDGALKDLLDRYPEVYEEGDLMNMGTNVKMLLSQKFTEKVYIYSEVYDIRIHMDIQNLYNDMERVNYVSGNFEKVLQTLEGITTYMVNDLDYVYDILKSGKADYTNVLLASYGYNYILEDDGTLDFRLDVKELIGDTICKFATFSPVDLTPQHFTQAKI